MHVSAKCSSNYNTIHINTLTYSSPHTVPVPEPTVQINTVAVRKVVNWLKDCPSPKVVQSTVKS